MLKFVIRAGGGGTRLWPYSREGKPKQFHALVQEHTMLQDAVKRLGDLAKPEDIFVSTVEGCLGLIDEQLPELAGDHIIKEPARRDTAPAVGLEAITIAKHFPDAVIASLGSDHLIQDGPQFCKLLEAAAKVIEKNPSQLLTLGVKPGYPETGYGYIEQGEDLGESLGEPVYQVKSFREKPDKETAQQFYEAGTFLWNSNMFIWRADAILNLFQEFQPKMYGQLMDIQAAMGTPDFESVLQDIYPQLERVAIDYAIIEKAPDIAVIPADVGWTDIGSWKALYDVLPKDENGNVVRGEAAVHNCKDCLFIGASGRVIGASDLTGHAIVDTPDAVLSLPLAEAQATKQVVEALKNQNLTKVLD